MGLLGIVADPGFATNHYLYVYATMAGVAVADANQVIRVVLGDDNKLTAERKAIINKGLYGWNNHNGGGLHIFNNHLYVSVGDSGRNPVDEAKIPRNRLPSCLNWANGKILRVNLDGSIPADNPLKGQTNVTTCDDWDQPFKTGAPDERVFAWGLRNPFRFWIDPTNGTMWIGDVGETRLEEISVGKGGQHFGYPFVEGTKAYTKTEQPLQPTNTCQGMTPATACTPPQYAYPHEGSSNCVIGGRILDGCGWPAPFNSRYIFGDNGSGDLWTLDVKPGRDGAVADSRKNFGKASGPASFRMSTDGALYIVEVAGGAIQKVTPKNPTTTTCSDVTPGTGGAGGTNSGTGGSPSAGGASSGGTNSGTGGGATTGGTSATGGTGAATGGTSNTAGGNTGKAGASASGGKSSGSGGSGNAAGQGNGSDDDGGCSCRMTSGQNIGAWAALSGLAIGAGLWRRRRAQNKSR
jgi:glucose/arabinose dehydrogenase